MPGYITRASVYSGVMDKDKLQAAAQRYIKHKVRAAIISQLEDGRGVSDLTAYDDHVTSKWFEEVRKLDYKNPDVFNHLSAIVHDAYPLAVRAVRESIGDSPATARGIADFYQTFNVDEMLLRGES